MADINLLQSQLKDTTELSNRRTGIFISLMIILMFLVVAVGAVLYILTKSVNTKAQTLAESNNNLQVQVNTEQQGLGDAKSYQAKLSNIKLLLGTHIYLTPVLNELSKSTYQRAKYLTVDIAQDTNKIHLEGQVDNYNELGKFLLGLTSASGFRNVKLLSVVPTKGTTAGYMFAVDMNALPDLYTKPK